MNVTKFVGATGFGDGFIQARTLRRAYPGGARRQGRTGVVVATIVAAKFGCLRRAHRVDAAGAGAREARRADDLLAFMPEENRDGTWPGKEQAYGAIAEDLTVGAEELNEQLDGTSVYATEVRNALALDVVAASHGVPFVPQPARLLELDSNIAELDTGNVVRAKIDR